MFAGEGSEILSAVKRGTKTPQLTTVIQELPDLPSKQWQDHVLEPMPPMLQYSAGQEWYVRLKDAIALQRVTVIDVTLKTVEVRGIASYRQPVRYAKSDIEFIEQIA